MQVFDSKRGDIFPYGLTVRGYAEQRRWDALAAHHHYFFLQEFLRPYASPCGGRQGGLGYSDRLVGGGIQDRRARRLNRLDARSAASWLHLIANNTRFVILGEGRGPNMPSRVLGLSLRRLSDDMPALHGFPCSSPRASWNRQDFQALATALRTGMRLVRRAAARAGPADRKDRRAAGGRRTAEPLLLSQDRRGFPQAARPTLRTALLSHHRAGGSVGGLSRRDRLRRIRRASQRGAKSGRGRVPEPQPPMLRDTRGSELSLHLFEPAPGCSGPGAARLGGPLSPRRMPTGRPRRQGPALRVEADRDRAMHDGCGGRARQRPRARANANP